MLVYQRVYWLSGCPASVQAPKKLQPFGSKELTLLIQQASSSTEVIKILRAHQFPPQKGWNQVLFLLIDGMDGMNDV